MTIDPQLWFADAMLTAAKQAAFRANLALRHEKPKRAHFEAQQSIAASAQVRSATAAIRKDKEAQR